MAQILVRSHCGAFLASILRRWSQRAGLTSLCISLVVILTLAFYYSPWNKPQLPVQVVYREPVPRQQNTSSKAKHGDYGTEDPHDPRFYNIISEEDALMFEPCQDINKSASPDYSKVTLADRLGKTYYIGEDIQATVILYDGQGKRKYSGGDQLRATIENKQLQASAPCVVTDNRDGTHTIMCEALWSGASKVNVTLAYTREAITSIYRIRTKILATRNIHGLFKNRTYTEKSICHPNNTQLLKLTNYTELCNMTYANSGMSFYCGKPKDVHLLCRDLKQLRTGELYPKLPITECEETLLKSGQRSLKQTVQVNVNGRIGNRNTSVIAKPSIPCPEYNVSLLWHSRKPTGFFYKGDWKIRNCLGARNNSYMSCLNNRHLYLFGDSTIRAWYWVIMERFQCQLITEKWWKEKWHKGAECYNKNNNFWSGWYPHSQPFYLGKTWDDARYTLYSVARRIDNIPRNTRAIVVVQLYMHFLALHHNVFKQRMQIIRRSIEKLLTQSSQSIVMIKAPHTFEGTPAGDLRLSDYYGYLYSKILYEVFEGLYDRVVLLNNRDTTLAQHVKWNHPDENIVNAMVDQMLNYACK